MRVNRFDAKNGWCGSWRFAPAALAVGIAVALNACSSGGTATGHALNPGFTYTDGLAPIRPGDQVGMLVVDLKNRSALPLVLDKVSFTGQGLGTVVRVVEVKLAPNVSGNHSVPGGAYQTDPPVDWWPPTRSCGKQLLAPLKGYRLAAGAIARVWVVFEAHDTGRFLVGHIMHYTQNGTRYQQRIPEFVKGTVALRAPRIPMDPQEKRCVRPTKTRLLPFP